MSKSVLPVFFSKSFIVSSLTFRSLLHSGASHVVAAAAAAKSLQSCPTLHDPIDSSSQGSPVPGIFQARTHVALVVKNPPANAGDIRDMGSIPELGKSHGGGHGNPLQESCLENLMDRGGWQAVVHRVTKS